MASSHTERASRFDTIRGMTTKTHDLPASSRTSRREDVGTILFSLWMVVGLMVDAHKHVTDPELETFWTPWHGLFYSGFLAVGAWLFVVTRRRYSEGGRFLDAAPVGYRKALIGVAIFAAGGVGDAVWHETFGVETSLDALLSPTHIVLFVGMLLIVSTPLRAAWLDWTAPRDPRLRDFGPALASLAFSTALVAFFFEYAWILAMDWVPRQVYDPNRDELFFGFGVIGIMVTTIILFGPAVVVMRRWRLPVGSITVLLLAVNAFIAVAFDADFSGIAPSLAAGLAADGMLHQGVEARVIAFATPAIMWLVYFFGVGQLESGLGWPPELWGGSTFFAALAVLAMHVGLDAASRIDHAETIHDNV